MAVGTSAPAADDRVLPGKTKRVEDRVKAFDRLHGGRVLPDDATFHAAVIVRRARKDLLCAKEPVTRLHQPAIPIVNVVVSFDYILEPMNMAISKPYLKAIVSRVEPNPRLEILQFFNPVVTNKSRKESLGFILRALFGPDC